MPFSGSLESLRTAGLNGTSGSAENRHATSYSTSANSQKTEERLFADERTRFVVVLDVSHFTPEEVRVKIADDMLVIEASHEEKRDEHGYVTRSLKRRYPLPKDIDAQNFVSELTRDGMLTVKAPKIDVHQRAKERAVPVQIIAGDPLKRNMKNN
jgi:HSP20 family molecular chaperone IbpA